MVDLQDWDEGEDPRRFPRFRLANPPDTIELCGGPAAMTNSKR